jgi:hypothetical protein
MATHGRGRSGRCPGVTGSTGASRCGPHAGPRFVRKRPPGGPRRLPPVPPMGGRQAIRTQRGGGHSRSGRRGNASPIVPVSRAAREGVRDLEGAWAERPLARAPSSDTIGGGCLARARQGAFPMRATPGTTHVRRRRGGPASPELVNGVTITPAVGPRASGCTPPERRDDAPAQPGEASGRGIAVMHQSGTQQVSAQTWGSRTSSKHQTEGQARVLLPELIQKPRQGLAGPWAQRRGDRNFDRTRVRPICDMARSDFVHASCSPFRRVRSAGPAVEWRPAVAVLRASLDKPKRVSRTSKLLPTGDEHHRRRSRGLTLLAR